MIGLEPPQKNDYPSPFRKVGGTRGGRILRAPSIYGTIGLRMDRAVDYIHDFRGTTGKQVNVSHLLVHAMANILRQLQTGDAASQRADRLGGTHTIGAVLSVSSLASDPNRTAVFSLPQEAREDQGLEWIVDQMAEHTAYVTLEAVPAADRGPQLIRRLFHLSVNPIQRLASLLGSTLNVDRARRAGSKASASSVMITDLRTFGLDAGHTLVSPSAKTPMILAYDRIKEKPVLEGSLLATRKTMDLTMTVDPKLVDDHFAAQVAETLCTWFESPYRYFGPIHGDGYVPRDPVATHGSVAGSLTLSTGA